MARSDAVRNRQLLVSAGRDVFAEHGPDATLEEIARRAGVGIGTLYRHFPTREAVVETIFEEHIREVVSVTEQCAAAENAWDGLAGFLEQVLELQARNLPLRDVFLRHPSGEGRVAEQREQIGRLLRGLVARARKEGTVRDDFTVGDLLFAMWSFMPLLEATATAAPAAWRRHLQILLDGMRPPAATPQRVRPLTQRQIEAAIAVLRSSHRRRRSA